MNDYMSIIEHANAGPLVRMLQAQVVLPRSEHFGAAAPGIAGLLGQVDPQLIRGAVAERASGQHTLH